MNTIEFLKRVQYLAADAPCLATLLFVGVMRHAFSSLVQSMLALICCRIVAAAAS